MRIANQPDQNKHVGSGRDREEHPAGKPQALLDCHSEDSGDENPYSAQGRRRSPEPRGPPDNDLPKVVEDLAGLQEQTRT